MTGSRFLAAVAVSRDAVWVLTISVLVGARLWRGAGEK